MFLSTALLVLKKDFDIELKSREIVYTTLLFALSCILIFSLTFVVKGQPLAEAAAGIVWIAIAFSGTLALGRTFERERYSETLRALMIAPAPRAAIYVGKLLGMVALLLAAEALIVPLVSVLFQANLLAQLPLLAPLLFLGTVGFAGVGTLFAAMLVRARTRDVLLPILLYPITVPVIIAGVRGTSALVQAPPDEAIAMLWIGLLTGFDVVFVTLALWTFEPLMTE